MTDVLKLIREVVWLTEHDGTVAAGGHTERELVERYAVSEAITRVAAMDPKVVERIIHALDDEDSPAPWIQRAFDMLGTAQANAAKVGQLQRSLAYHHDDLNRLRRRASTEECDEEICIEAKRVRNAQNAKREAERAASPEPPPAR